MRKSLLVSFGCLLLIAVSCGRHSDMSDSRASEAADSLYTEETVKNIFREQPERALEVLDSAELLGNIPDFRADFYRARIYAFADEIEKPDTAIQICEALLRHDSVMAEPTRRFNVLEELTRICRMMDDYPRWLGYATELADLCREQGWQTEALRTEADKGVVLIRLGQKAEGLKKLDDAISQLDSKRTFNELDASVIAMKRKINVLYDMGRFADIIPLAQRIRERLDDYAQHPDDYSDQSYREPNDEADRTAYVQMYKAQALGFMACAYAYTGQLAQARRAVDEFERTDYGHTLNGHALISDAWVALGDFDKALATANQIEARMGADTLNADYAEVLRVHALAAHANGRYGESKNYWLRHDDVTRIVNDSLQASEAHNYAARYHAQQQQLTIQQKEAHERLLCAIAIALGVGLLCAICAVVFIFRQRRQTARKNRVLVAHVQEMLEYKERLEALTSVASEPTSGSAVLEEALVFNESMPQRAAAQAPERVSDEDLFQFLSDEIQHHKLFLDPNMGRQTIAERYGLSERRIGAAFSQESRYGSLPSFVCQCRLEYACRLLTQRPDMSIGDVAKASGFSNVSVFTRCFKQKYTVAPTAYRAQQE